jgi:hypothetical protein
VKPGLLAAALLLAGLAARPAVGDERALYLAEGEDIRLFDQYDNDGYSLSVAAGAGGSVQLRVRVSDSPLASQARFPTGAARDASLPPAPERDSFALQAAGDSRLEADAVSRILIAIASRVRYDPDLRQPQDPATVFRAGRGSCVGFSELAVDLLRRVGIRARTVQGIVRTRPGEPSHEPRIGGSYHRWIEVYYPDRGYVFSDPSASINGVDARYIPFRARSLARPRALTLVFVDQSGGLSYAPVTAGQSTLRERASGLPAGGGR